MAMSTIQDMKQKLDQFRRNEMAALGKKIHEVDDEDTIDLLNEEFYKAMGHLNNARVAIATMADHLIDHDLLKRS